MDLQALVLAAGLGTRLWPLTADRAKPAVPFLGQPLVRGVARWMAGHGLSRIVVNTHHQAESVRDALAELDGLRVDFSHEPEVLGTAGAIGAARDRGLLSADRPLLIVNGKLSTDLDLGAAAEHHRRSGAAVTMVLRPNPRREAFREVKVQAGHVVGFGEGRVPESAAPLLFTGVHILAPEVVAACPATFSDTIRDVYPALIEAGRVAAHVDASPRWWEFSTLERYLELHLEAARLGLGPEVSAARDVQLAADAEIRRSVLWEGTRVGAGARLDRVVLGAGVEIAAGSTLSDVVVVRLDRVGVVERGAVHGSNVHVPLA